MTESESATDNSPHHERNAMGDAIRQSVGLTQPYCDYYGCTTEPNLTDGASVMCSNHERTAYSTSTYWRRITRVISQPDGPWPYYVAEY